MAKTSEAILFRGSSLTLHRNRTDQRAGAFVWAGKCVCWGRVTRTPKSRVAVVDISGLVFEVVGSHVRECPDQSLLGRGAGTKTAFHCSVSEVPYLMK